MKNLLIYISPKGFDEETQKLAKLQIDNSLELGWKRQDILVVTNFPYKYNGVSATVITSDAYCPYYKEASKIFAILKMFDLGMIGEALYWFHDFDAYQLSPFDEEEVGLEGLDAGFTDYGRKPDWNTGSFFFKKTSESIFAAIAQRIKPGLNAQRRRQHEEQALMDLTSQNVDNINSKIKRLNCTYNFGMRKVNQCYQLAEKPLKVLHFHPYHARNNGLNTLGIAIYGQSDLGIPLMDARLAAIFNRYGYT